VRDSATQEEVAAATAYEHLHVPALFQQWAPRVVEAAQIRPGHRVLDVACGTGVLAREVAVRLGGEGSVAGLDVSPGMLAVARRLAPAIKWGEGTAESLPYEDNSFDAVVCQFGLMFFTDRHKAVREMKRVLAPGGWMAVAVWESLENSEAYPTEVALLERMAGPRAADALRAPFVLGDRRELTTLFEDAGVASVETATHHGTARFPSIRTMVEADLRGWLPVMGVVLTEEQIQGILEEAEPALSRYVTLQGTVMFDSPAHIVAGRKAQL
jgi:ubiquinone/menaquinone biosynthesis C-methylase UbiE